MIFIELRLLGKEPCHILHTLYSGLIWLCQVLVLGCFTIIVVYLVLGISFYSGVLLTKYSKYWGPIPATFGIWFGFFGTKVKLF